MKSHIDLRLHWRWKVILLVVLAALPLLTPTPTSADRPPPPTPVSNIADDDGDGIFDDLAAAAPNERFDTVVVLRKSVTTARLDLVAQIEADRIVTPTLDQATLWFGVNKTRTDFGVGGNADGAASYSKDDIVIAVLNTGIDAGVAAATKLSSKVKPSNFFELWRLPTAQFFEDNSPFSVVLPPILAGILFLYLLSRRFRLRVERRR